MLAVLVDNDALALGFGGFKLNAYGRGQKNVVMRQKPLWVTTQGVAEIRINPRPGQGSPKDFGQMPFNPRDILQMRALPDQCEIRRSSA